VADRIVVLDDLEWQSMIALLAQAQGPGISWATINPLLTKITQQLQPVSASGGYGNGSYIVSPDPPEHERPASGRTTARAAKEGRA